MPMASKEMCKLLKKNGFIEIKGGPTGHRKFFNPVSRGLLLFLVTVKT